MNRVVTRLGFTTLALVAGSVAFAQTTATTGSMSGTVMDASGAPVAGATVTASGAQGARTATTGPDGGFRLGLLNPGEYQVSIGKAGMATLKQKVAIQVNQNTPVSAKLSKEAEKVVEVVAAGAAVDVTNLSVGLNTSLDNITSVPKGRDFSDLAFLSPGVVSSGFGNAPSIGGASGAENQYVVDGLETTDFRRGFQGASFVNDFIEQVDIQTGGLKPEYNALGGVFNAVTRSGANNLAASAWLTFEPKGLQAVPKRNKYFIQGSLPGIYTGTLERYDVGGWVGGAIIKDKLFYFAGLDAIFQNEDGFINNNGLESGEDKVTQVQFMGKLNWFITQNMQLTAFLNVNDQKDDQSLLRPVNGDGNLAGVAKAKVFNWNLNFDWTIRPDLFFTAKVGATKLDNPFTPADNSIAVSDQMWFDPAAPGPGAFNNPLGLAPTTNYRRGGAGLYNTEDQNKTTQAKMDLSWFVGTHNIKLGVSWMESKYTEVQRLSGGERITLRNTGATTGLGTNPLHFGGVQRQFLTTDATVTSDYTAFYIQDTWDIANSGFRLFYGFRYEIQDQKDLDGHSFMKFDKFQDVWQPRMGFTWDVFKDGKTKVSGSYARYFERIPQRLAIRVFANEVYLQYRYSRNSAHPTGPSTYNPATGAYTFSGTPTDTRDFATPFSFDPVAEGTKLPQRNEILLGIDQSLGNGWTVGIHGKYRTLKNPIEDITPTLRDGSPIDEGPYYLSPATVPPYGQGAGAAILANPGQTLSWRPNPNSLSLILLSHGITTNNYGVNILDYYNPSTGLFTFNNSGYDEARNRYQSVDVTVDRRTDRAYFNVSYTWSRLEGNYEGLISSSNGQSDNNITASWDFYQYVGYGLLPLDRTSVAKAFGSYRFDVPGGDLTVGGRWTYQSGTPKSIFDDGRTDGVTDFGGYGDALPVHGELGGNGRNPATNQVDMNLTYGIKAGKRLKISPSLDVFNLFNSRTATGSVEQLTTQAATVNASYGYENGWLTGRRYRFGVKFQF